MFSWLLSHRRACADTEESAYNVTPNVGDEVGWDKLLDVESNVLVLTGQNGMPVLEKTLLQLCAQGRATYWFSKGYDSCNEQNEENFRHSGRYDLDYLDQFLLHHKCAIETFDIPPTVLILDDTLDLGDSHWVKLMQSAQDLHLTIIMLTKNLNRIRPALVAKCHHFVMCRAMMTRRERRAFFEQLVRKAKMPSSYTIPFLEKATSARRFRRGRHATVISRDEGKGNVVTRISIALK